MSAGGKGPTSATIDGHDGHCRPAMPLITLALLWIAWCALHSLLISRQAHLAAEKVLSRHKRTYRLGYVLFSVISLLPVLWFQWFLSRICG